MWFLVLAFVLPTVAVVFASILLTVRTIGFFRQVKATGRTVGAEVERVLAGADQAATKAEALNGGTAEMSSSLARLRASQARLSLLLGAWKDVRDSVGSVTAFIPRK